MRRIVSPSGHYPNPFVVSLPVSAQLGVKRIGSVFGCPTRRGGSPRTPVALRVRALTVRVCPVRSFSRSREMGVHEGKMQLRKGGRMVDAEQEK